LSFLTITLVSCFISSGVITVAPEILHLLIVQTFLKLAFTLNRTLNATNSHSAPFTLSRV
jgi:hypothetical protein